MDVSWTDTWKLRSELYAFFGNSLLKVMAEQSAVGLDPAFWEGFPLEAADGHLRSGLDGLVACARGLAASDRTKALEQVGVEYTRLFVGPGRPAAPPWETLYREGGTVLFGQPTFEMRQLFAREGVRAGADSHQFEDHLGFELLYLGVRGAAFADAPPTAEQVVEIKGFIETHPLSFIERLLDAAREAATVGYYPALIELVWGYLLWDLALLDEWAEAAIRA
ncbi:MAG: molecular chaperone TorD family protein [Coriobacteriales bacterium]|jgi:TorA maturation chaperone TorD|nr:molecular chaperone TorD family protein [Coriobacteriales bacterium]